MNRATVINMHVSVTVCGKLTLSELNTYCTSEQTNEQNN